MVVVSLPKGGEGEPATAGFLKTDGRCNHFQRDEDGEQEGQDEEGQDEEGQDEEGAAGQEQAVFRLAEINPQEDAWVTEGEHWCTKQQAQEIRESVAEQTEALLFLAHKLQLEPLISHMHAFIAGNASTMHDGSVLYGQLSLVFTERVLHAAVPIGACQATTDAFISSVLSFPAGFTASDSVSQLLEPCDDDDVTVLEFPAKLRQQFMGCAAGTEVDVSLDLAGDDSNITIGSVKWPVQLLLGRPVTDDADYEALMGVKRRRV